MGLLFGTHRPPVDGGWLNHTRRMRDLDRRQTAIDALNRDCDLPYRVARQRILDAVAAGSDWAFIRLPFPFTVEDADHAQELMNLAHHHGFALRPGGAAGHAADIIRLERS